MLYIPKLIIYVYNKKKTYFPFNVLSLHRVVYNKNVIEMFNIFEVYIIFTFELPT